MKDENIKNVIKPGDIVLYRVSLLKKKEGKVRALSRDGNSCIIGSTLVMLDDICKIVQRI